MTLPPSPQQRPHAPGSVASSAAKRQRHRLQSLCAQLTAAVDAPPGRNDGSVNKNDTTIAARRPLPPRLTLGVKELSSESGNLGLLRASNDLLGDPARLRAQLQQDGYVYLKRLVPRARTLEAYRVTREILEREGQWPWGKFSTDWTGCAEVMGHIDAPELREVFQKLFDTSEVASLPFKWIRSMPPQTGRFTGFSQFHVDRVYMGRGTERVLTAWLPMEDIDYALGGLAVLEKSHTLPGFARLRETYGQHDFMNLPGVKSNGGNFTADPEDLLAMEPSARFLTSEFEAGDALIFTNMTVHGSVANKSDRVRLSADVRYQPAKEEMDARYIVESTSLQKDVYSPTAEQMATNQETATWIVAAGRNDPGAISWAEQKRRWGVSPEDISSPLARRL